jgi:hypothetical protein
MESLLVIFRIACPVNVDGTPCGETNRIFQISKGIHDIDLGDIKDCHPVSQTVLVENTSPDAPKVVTFT